MLTPALVAALAWTAAATVHAADAKSKAAPVAKAAAGAEVASDEEVAAAEEGSHVDGAADASRPDPLATDPDLALWTLGVFVLMLALLSQVAWKPILESLKAREEGITGKLADAERMHAEARTMLAEHEARLAGTADEVRKLLEEARRDADTTVAKAKADAKAEFDAERNRAQRDIAQAADAAVRQLAERSAGLAIDLAGRVMKQEISADRQSELVREALGRFAASGPSSN